MYPWLCMAVMANVGGWLADSLVSRGVDRTLVRKVMQTIGFMGPAFFLSQLRLVTDSTWAVLCMCACQGLDAFSQSGLYSNHQARPLLLSPSSVAHASPSVAVLVATYRLGSAASAWLSRSSSRFATSAARMQDIGPKYAGVLLGLSNTAGVLAGVLSTAATGYILSVGCWNDVWLSAIFFYCLGTLIWNTLATGEQIFE